ncbi:MAG TPA: prolyl oligopeptidase family serine peptidase [Caulobacteraceae bacterium]
MKTPHFLTAAATAAILAASGARSAERAIHSYVEIALSPDGTRLASVEGDTTPAGPIGPRRQLLIRRLDVATPTNVTLPCGNLPACAPASIAWSPDGARLAFTLRDPSGHGRAIYETNADGGDLARILQFDGTLEHLRFLKDGRLAMLAVAGANREVGATQAGAPITGDLGGPPPEQRIAVLTGSRLDFVSPANLFVYEYDPAPDGSFVGTAAAGDGDANWWTAKLYRFTPAGAQVIFSPQTPQMQIAHPRVSPDGHSVVFVGGIMSDFGSTGGDVYLAPLSGGSARDLTPGMTASAGSVAWDCDGHLLASLLAGASNEIVRLQRDGSQPTVLWSGQATLGGPEAGVSLGCPAGVTATTRQDFSRPPELAVGPIGAWKDITSANAGLEVPVEARSLTWRSDAFQVQGWLLLPASAGKAGKLPMITIVHGGPAAAVTPRFIEPGTDRDLLTRGYALFLPNPRGSFGQGEAFTLANVRDFGHGDLRDILAGVDAAIAAAPIDPNRLGLTGGSYGGYMTMWAVTQTHRFKAAVAAAGISDWLSYYGENGIDEWMIPFFGKSAYDDPAVYARSSPIEFIKNVVTPTLEFVGAQDIECPYPQTQEFWHALRDLGVPTFMAVYPGEGHGLRDPSHAGDAERRTLSWFDTYLR